MGAGKCNWIAAYNTFLVKPNFRRLDNCVYFVSRVIYKLTYPSRVIELTSNVVIVKQVWKTPQNVMYKWEINNNKNVQVATSL